MAPSENLRIQQFSSPNVSFMGVATGTVNDNDNVRQILENASSVSAYRDYSQPLVVSINGPNQVSGGQSYNWCSTVFNCNSGITYSWEYSENGFIYTDHPGSQSCTTINVSSNITSFFLRLTVSCASGQTETEVKQITVQNGSGGGGIPEKRIGNKPNNLLDDSRVEVYPNPFIDEINIFTQNNWLQNFEVELRDVSGRVVRRLTHYEINKNYNGVYLSTLDLDAGIYILLIRGSSGEVLHSSKLVKLL